MGRLLNDFRLAQAFAKLSPEEKRERLAVARKHAEAGTCFMCAHIINKTGFKEFPKEGRIAHLMICCKPKGGLTTSRRTRDKNAGAQDKREIKDGNTK